MYHQDPLFFLSFFLPFSNFWSLTALSGVGFLYIPFFLLLPQLLCKCHQFRCYKGLSISVCYPYVRMIHKRPGDSCRLYLHLVPNKLTQEHFNCLKQDSNTACVHWLQPRHIQNNYTSQKHEANVLDLINMQISISVTKSTTTSATRWRLPQFQHLATNPIRVGCIVKKGNIQTNKAHYIV